ncbi:Ig-like domain-containing protein [Pseudenhygromyxa sp. WMMC2535]|uniref:Ig-like domain-containing protein n=1 Tax=Pseudenhygromyxa sp. WMMC2535 TaxID=2712867 RepID=UPI001556A925|nr:Ig-like domain-containing protein [Pseudenhygromyxa sp. WMMC2535]NVB40129.1 Ig-like domain-containing protein [Pseudenhygromyxa sp. WMMC2535]
MKHIATKLLTASLLTAGLATPWLISTPAHADVANEPATAEITSPTNGQVFDGTTATFDVSLDVYEGDGLGSVRLLVDDEEVAVDSAAPWGFENVLVTGEGMHTLVAVAVSTDGTERTSETVEIALMEGGSSEEESRGCSVTSGARLGGAGGLILFGLFTIGLARRRGRRE